MNIYRDRERTNRKQIMFIQSTFSNTAKAPTQYQRDRFCGTPCCMVLIILVSIRYLGSSSASLPMITGIGWIMHVSSSLANVKPTTFSKTKTLDWLVKS